MESVTTAPEMRVNDQLNSLGEERDRLDLIALYEIFCALAPSYKRFLGTKRNTPENEGASKINHLLRLAIVDVWQEPRMPKERHAHNKPHIYPWSPQARDLFFAARADGTLSLSNKLILEHAIPIGILYHEMMMKIIDGNCTRDEWTELFAAAHGSLSFAILAKNDDDLINRNGHRSAMVADDPSPWARYRKAGLVQESFMALNADPRWTVQAGSIA